MGRLNFAGPLGLSIAAAFPVPALADVGVPSAARMVHDAKLIVVGALASANLPTLVPTRVLKGSTGGQRALALADPTAGRFLALNLAQVPQIVGNAPTVALGSFNEAQATLSLYLVECVLLAPGHRYDTFDSATLESTVAFLERLLGYSTPSAQDPDGTVRMLVTDVAGRHAAAALAYLEIAVQTDFGPLTATQIRAVCVLALARSKPDAASARQFADIAPVFPVSLAAPFAIALMGGLSGEDELRLRRALQSMLTARGAKLGANADSGQMQSAFQALSPTLRRADARRLLPVFDATLPTLRDQLADVLMEAVVGSRPPEQLAGLPAAQRKAIWRREIDAMPD